MERGKSTRPCPAESSRAGAPAPLFWESGSHGCYIEEASALVRRKEVIDFAITSTVNRYCIEYLILQKKSYL